MSYGRLAEALSHYGFTVYSLTSSIFSDCCHETASGMLSPVVWVIPGWDL
jgi:hypothetical protein